MQGIYNKIDILTEQTYIIRIPKEVEDIDWSTIIGFSAKVKIVIALCDMSPTNIQMCKNNKLDYYWAYPATTYEEVESLTMLGVSQLYIGGPLYFDLKQVVERSNLPIRVVANVCYDNYLPRHDGIRGAYIRPEDVKLYEQYVTTIEFITETVKQEKAMYKIYAIDKEWPGNLNLLLTNFNHNVDNRVLPADFAAARIQCRQNCMRTGTCHFCQTVMEYVKTLDQIKQDWIPGRGFNKI